MKIALFFPVDDEIAKNLADFLKDNHTLRILGLCNSIMSERGGNTLLYALQFNYTLEKLDVEGKKFSSQLNEEINILLNNNKKNPEEAKKRVEAASAKAEAAAEAAEAEAAAAKEMLYEMQQLREKLEQLTQKLAKSEEHNVELTQKLSQAQQQLTQLQQ
jgi:small-conductance mechanosensitive channel